MKLRSLPKTKNLKGQRILVRVDWNVPLDGSREPEASLKIERSLPLLRELSDRGAIVIALTHIGRPTKREASLSTKHLLPLLKNTYHLDVIFHEQSVANAAERNILNKQLSNASPGTIHLLENVRFEVGEEKNALSLAKAYASLGDIFINDAFASCHRAHASVVGLTKHLPSFAGPSLIEEVENMSYLINKPKRPFVAVIGGKKLSTKLPVLKTLLSTCDMVMVGGAMAHPYFVAAGHEIGKSYLEKDMLKETGSLIKNQRLVLPRDVMVSTKLEKDSALRCLSVDRVGKKDIIVDAGYATLKDWGQIIQNAKTVLWNGPIGVTELHAAGAGSRFLAKVIGASAKGKALGIVGGGDTLPVVLQTKTQTWFDFVSTGGGAMLEFLIKKGKLPGIVPLLK